jgi:hypothetical protein
MHTGPSHNSLFASLVETLRATSLPLCFFSSFLFYCTAPPPIIIEALPNRVMETVEIDSICSFKAFGDIKFSLRGERRSAKIDVIWRGDSNCTIALYTLLGGTFASVAVDSSGAWNITAADSMYKKNPHDKVSIGGFFDYSLTFREFLRVATGRLLDRSFIREPCDSLYPRGKKAFLYWHEDPTRGRGYAITVVIDRKHISITDVIYGRKRPEPWDLSISRTKNGAPEEIRFKDGNNNYFYLKYGTVVVKRGKHCRTERL